MHTNTLCTCLLRTTYKIASRSQVTNKTLVPYLQWDFLQQDSTLRHQLQQHDHCHHRVLSRIKDTGDQGETWNQIAQKEAIHNT